MQTDTLYTQVQIPVSCISPTCSTELWVFHYIYYETDLTAVLGVSIPGPGPFFPLPWPYVNLSVRSVVFISSWVLFIGFMECTESYRVPYLKQAHSFCIRRNWYKNHSTSFAPKESEEGKPADKMETTLCSMKWVDEEQMSLLKVRV